MPSGGKSLFRQSVQTPPGADSESGGLGSWGGAGEFEAMAVGFYIDFVAAIRNRRLVCGGALRVCEAMSLRHILQSLSPPRSAHTIRRPMRLSAGLAVFNHYTYN